MAAFLRAVHNRNFHERILRRERVFRERCNPLAEFTDEELYSRYRFDRNGVLFITDLIREEIESPTERSCAIPPEIKVLIALQFYACGTFQRTVGDTIRISQPSVSRIINLVSSSLSRRLGDFIKWPAAADIPDIQRGFFTIAGFPGIVGIIDGTHIRITAPNAHEEQFVNRKNYHSINVQVVVDNKCNFTQLNAKRPGSTHDSRVLRESSIANVFERGQGENEEVYLLGNTGYPSKPWLLTPFLQPGNRPEARYNGAHRTTRSLVERTIGQWKRRFHCLHGEIRLSPERTCRVIAACAVLHNIAKQQGFPDIDEDDPMDDPPHPQPDQPAQLHDNGDLVRNHVVHTYFQ
ncbi:putative nuclease HARBI1 [Patiria miniata]|uniref:Putative nuclease HARBI1 n=1 Tax=Patiria miniata TaxID=46514 RepID=A0A913ZHK4_PATMI|nr:putative nuclease HARBI1 [Patiria miniata]